MKTSESWLLPTLFLLQSIFVGTTFQSVAFTIPAYLIAMTAAWLLRRRTSNGSSPSLFSRFSRYRGSMLSLTVTVFFFATAAWRLTFHLGETINPLAYGVDSVAHISLFIGLVLYGFYPRYGHPSMLGLGLLVVMLSVAAGGSSQSLAGQVSVALLAVIGFLLSSRLILNHWSHGERFEADAQCFHIVKDNGRTNLLFSALALSIILMTTSAVAHVTGIVLPDLQGLVQSSLQSTLDSTVKNTIISTSKYVRGNRIGSIRRSMKNEPNEIALMTYSSVRPGYLKGNAFDDYEDAYWSAVDNESLSAEQRSVSFEPEVFGPTGDAKTRLEGRSTRRPRRFAISDSKSPRFATVEVHNQPMRGPVFFVPMNVRWVECNARNVRVSCNGILEYGPDVSNPYVLGIDWQPTIEVLDKKRRDILLTVPVNLKDECDEVAEAVCGKRPTARAKAAALQEYFQNEFEYSLQRKRFFDNNDPVLRFLKLKHPAHCELFASATALLLRSAGVPARYVTGYVATEFESKQGSWIARNRDAHAWVEAYDDQTKTWFSVESTPGRTYQSLLTNGSKDLLENNRGTGLDEKDTDKRGLISKVIGWVMSMRATDPLTAAFRIIQLPLFLLVVYLLWKRFIRADGSELNSEDVKSKLMLAKVDRIVGKHRLVRSPFETLHQFAVRVEEHAQQLSQQPPYQADSENAVGKKFQAYAQWYRHFAESRYQGKMPEPLSS